MANKWGNLQKHDDDSTWQYYIEKRFAWTPMFYNEDHPVIWMRFYWVTWPVDIKTGQVIEMYRQILPSEPCSGPP